MTGAAQQLSALRELLRASFGPAGERVLAQPLMQLESAMHAEHVDPECFGPLLDQLEDLSEALLRESGWVEAKRGPA